METQRISEQKNHINREPKSRKVFYLIAFLGALVASTLSGCGKRHQEGGGPNEKFKLHLACSAGGGVEKRTYTAEYSGVNLTQAHTNVTCTIWSEGLNSKKTHAMVKCKKKKGNKVKVEKEVRGNIIAVEGHDVECKIGPGNPEDLKNIF